LSLKFDQIKDQQSTNDTPPSKENLSTFDSPLKEVYEKRVVAFIDILGFRNIVMKSSQHVNSSEIIPEAKQGDLDQRIFAALQISPESYTQAFINEFNISEDEKETIDLRVSTFSDSVIITVPEDALNFALLVYCVTYMVRELLRNGFLTRGGVECGEVYHAKNRSNYAVDRVFGPAFIKAYDLESRQAGSARVILSNIVWRQVRNWSGTNCQYCKFIEKTIIRDKDGPAKIDILHHYKDKEIKSIESELHEIKAQMQNVLEYYTESPKIFSKLAKFSHDFNKMIVDYKYGNDFLISDYHLPN
jgi:hypothetical protein